MPTVPILPLRKGSAAASPLAAATSSHGLPPLLQTPGGLAILELQGTINLPPGAQARIDHAIEAGAPEVFHTPVGKLVFPDYHPRTDGSSSPPSTSRTDDTSWMKRVHLYVGESQRLTGSVTALPKPLAVLRRARAEQPVDSSRDGEQQEQEQEQLDIVDIIRYRIYFKTRPEPISRAMVPN
ncbi:hypothetical protein KEM52_006043 [Ascosphaera acerosa]|nr:hypothetical protein KEM52_006043 [Ascosphaera acerosa]